MKRILSLFLVVVICLSLCACELPEGIIITPKPTPDETGNATLQTDPSEVPTAPATDPAPTETQPPKPTKEEAQACIQYYYIYCFLNRYTSYAQRMAELGGEMDYDSTNPSIFETLTVKDVVNDCVYKGMEAMAFCYETLPKLEDAVNKWSSEQINFVSDKDAFRNYWSVRYWDCQKLLDGISVTRDVLLFQYESSWDREFWNRWVYDAEGRIAWTNADWRSEDIYSSSDFPIIGNNGFGIAGTYLYDENGILKTIQTRYQPCGQRETMSFDYDGDSGKLNIEVVEHGASFQGNTIVQHQIRTYNYSYQFVFEDEGLLIQRPDEMGSTRYYYDDAGRLIKQAYCDYDGDFDPELGGQDKHEYLYAKVEYTYDENGHLSSAVASTKRWFLADVLDENGFVVGVRSYVYREQTNQIEYTCDEQGRVVEKTVHYGEDIIYRNNGTRPEVIQQASTTVTHYVYGDYYIYTPVE